MTPEKTHVIFFVLASLMWVIWLVGTRFAFAALRRNDSGPAEDIIEGEAIVPGDAKIISQSVADQIAMYSSSGQGPIQIIERTTMRLKFRRTPGPLIRPGPFFDDGEMTFLQEGENVRVRYAASLRRILRAARLVCVIVCYAWGGVLLIGIPILVWFLAVTNESEQSRWQVFQTFQMIHGAWPPYLIGVLIRFMRGIPDRYFRSLLSNRSS